MTTTTTTTYAKEFESSPRYKSISAIFESIAELPDAAPIEPIMAAMNACMRTGNGIERDRLPDLVRKALADRGFSHRF